MAAMNGSTRRQRGTAGLAGRPLPGLPLAGCCPFSDTSTKSHRAAMAMTPRLSRVDMPCGEK